MGTNLFKLAERHTQQILKKYVDILTVLSHRRRWTLPNSESERRKTEAK